MDATKLKQAVAVAPLLVVLVLTPLLMRAHLVDDPSRFLFAVLPRQLDYFAWWKAAACLSCGVAAIVALVLPHRGFAGPALAERRRWHRCFSVTSARYAPSSRLAIDAALPAQTPQNLCGAGLVVGHAPLPRTLLSCLALYLALVWASALGSDNRPTSVFGFACQNEGALALTAYAAFALLAARVSGTKDSVQMLVATALGTAGVAWTLGVCEFFGHPLISTNGAGAPLFWLQRGSIVGTLMHANFVGAYAALMLPLAFGLFLTTRKKIAAAALLILILLGTANVIGSQSRGGMVGATVGLGCVVVLAHRQRVAQLWLKSAAATVAVVILVAIGFPSIDHQLKDKLALETTVSHSLRQGDQQLAIEALDVDGTSAHLRVHGDSLRVYAVGERILLTDFDGKPLLHRVEQDGTLLLDDRRYADFRLLPGTDPRGRMLTVRVGAYDFPLVLGRDSVRLAIPGGSTTTLTPTTARPPDKWELLLSARGYIWNRTLPLLRGKTLLGAGPGAFASAFPQRDFAGKLNVYNTLAILVDKPHSQYLQMAHASGLLSLAVILALWIVILARPLPSPLGPGLKGAIAAYLVSALVNDSVIAVAPTFWILVGLGAGLQWSAMPKPAKPAVSRISVFTLPSRKQIPLSE